MDDVSKLGPLWVGQLTKEVASRRNRAAESLLTIKPDGDYAKQHRMLIGAADAMLAAPQLIAALKEARRAIGDHYAPNDCYATGPLTGDPIRDLVECPACSAIAMYDAVIAAGTA